MVCSVIEVRFESALYSWVDNLMLIVLGILSLPKSIKEYWWTKGSDCLQNLLNEKAAASMLDFLFRSIGKAQWAFLKFTVTEQPCFKFQQVTWVLCNPAECYKNLTNCSGCENCGNSWWTAAVAPHPKRVLVVLVFSCNSHMDKILLSLVMCCCVLILNYQQDRFKYKVLFGSKHTDEWLDFW